MYNESKRLMMIIQERWHLRVYTTFSFTLIYSSLVLLTCTVSGQCRIARIKTEQRVLLSTCKKKLTFSFLLSSASSSRVDFILPLGTRLTDSAGHRLLSFSQYCWSIALINKCISKDLFYLPEYKTRS